MAHITLHTSRLEHNYRFLSGLFSRHAIEWAMVVKMLCGHTEFLKEVLSLGPNDVCDSRLSNLKKIKKIDPSRQTVYIKPPAKRLAKSIVSFADVSFNTEIETLKLLSLEAGRQNKVHKVILMLELGELREGIMGAEFMDFFQNVRNLKHISIIGIGANLNCFNGILPDQDKMRQLMAYREAIRKQFGVDLPYISGGSSVTIPLLFTGAMPPAINHFRVGETLFFGTDVYHQTMLEGMVSDVFVLTGEIIELNEKPMVPTGTAGVNLVGDTVEYDQSLKGRTSTRAILDIGLLDIDFAAIRPREKGIEILGGSSDMLILDLGDNGKEWKVGDTMEFSLNYLSTLRAMNSEYIDKKIQR